ncbi:ARF guanine-nucleotide exchange factor GNL2 [Ananas comosus]|uniref:ARF guanine-nucleotide exchange factor GNL2 n=1 Tax=Ananas comosus TaxID=4615 RepID=A0A199UVV1_ANACO|nr:ARF guanine-nucleotide exchange factor GNL2 [Ananas comosus]
MAKAHESLSDDESKTDGGAARRRDPRLKELGISCMLNTEVGSILAVIRRPSPSDPIADDPTAFSTASSHLVNSLKSLRSLIFHPRHSAWRFTDPPSTSPPSSTDDVPAAATGVALSAVLKILRLDVFDERTPGARDAIHSIVSAITNCRLERTDPISEDAVLTRVLQLLSIVLRARASVLLTDHAVCTVINACFQVAPAKLDLSGSLEIASKFTALDFQVVQQSAHRTDLLQRSARHTMHDLVQAVFARLPEVRAAESGDLGSDLEDDDGPPVGYGARCMVDIFHFLCSLLNVGEMVDFIEGYGSPSISSDEDVQLFALVLINSAVELGGEAIGKHPKLLRMIQDDLFHHLIHYATRSSPLVLSMICSTVLNLYHFLRRSLRLQLEAFFTYALLRIAAGIGGIQLQEVAIEGAISFLRQPTFAIETYVNYDCDPIRHNVFEEMLKLLCKIAFPVTNPALPMQIQAFEGLVSVISNVADRIEVEKSPARDSYNLELSDYKPFWIERCEEDESNPDTWVDFVRTRKLRKKKIMIAANHYNRDEKKGFDYLNLSNLVPSPPDSKSLAYFFRYTPGLDKNKIGDYLGDPSEFNLSVLKEFTETFDFSGVILDIALRTYLETFRLPGESQKIQRILEAFSERFYEQQSSEIFVSKDAVFILCYSLIMLNTDQHNPQVKKKMTEEEFIRNNRAINGGMDLPREYLSELFHSISTNAITLFGQTGLPVELNSNKWADLVKRSRTVEPYITCEFKHKLSRELFAAISGPAVATLAAIFEHTEDEEILHECVEGLISVARIARYGLEDILDELLCCLCKFTTLLNPYATAEETLFTFSNELKPRMATLALFTIANKYGESVRGAWKNLVDCLLKLKRLKVLPQSVIEPGNTSAASNSDVAAHPKTESGVIFPSSHSGFGGTSRYVSGLIGRFSQFLSLETGADSMLNAGSEFENNLKIIQQCRIGSIFTESSKLPDESLQNLGRALVFAAAGKGQKFSTPVEEEETVGFCWDLLAMITTANLHRFTAFWPQLHDSFAVVSQFPLFSPCPFAEKAIVALFKIALKLLSGPAPRLDKLPEELIFKSINLMWKLDKEILDTCCESISESTRKILSEHPRNVQTALGWKTLLHLLSVTGRLPETFDQGVEAIIKLLSEGTYVTRLNYAYCIEAAFGFAALKISPLETSSKILDLMAGSVDWLIQWHKSGFSDPGSGCNSGSSFTSNSSSTSSADEPGQRGSPGLAASLFVKLAEALRKTSLVRREEIRNQAVAALRRCFAAAAPAPADAAAEEAAALLGMGPASMLACFNQVVFAMVDDLLEKMLEYARRENSEREMRSMEGTLKSAMDLLAEVLVMFLVPISQSPGFRSFWLGVLRRMDTCMKASLGEAGESALMQETVPALLKRMILEMKEKEVLVQREGDELWEITNIQIQWIAPSVKEELFPEEF